MISGAGSLIVGGCDGVGSTTSGAGGGVALSTAASAIIGDGGLGNSAGFNKPNNSLRTN